VSIPLTFDWSTLAWLKTRLSLLWRRRARLGLRQLAFLILLGVFSGCVPVTRFEEAQSAAQVEAEGRRRDEQQIAQLKAENQQLRSQMQQDAKTLDEREQALSQAALDSSTQGKQREDAEGMVEQLRGELARVGGDLRSFHDDNQRLSAALDAAAARGRALSLLMRDIALSLPEPVATGQYGLDVDASGAVLHVPREQVLADDASVKPEAEPLLKAVARIMKLHQDSRLRVEDTSAKDDAIAVSRLVTALGERGIAADRFQPLVADAAPVALSATPAPAMSGSPEIVLGFSAP
jgi:hypothetical protein